VRVGEAEGADLGSLIEQIEVALHGSPRADPEAVEALDVRPEYLRTAMMAIRDAHGSIGGYLEACVGLGPEDRAELRDALLEELPAFP